MRSLPNSYLFHMAVLPLLFIAGCGTFRDTTLGRLAAHDLDCPIDQVEITHDAPFSKSFQGCGRTVEYARGGSGGSVMGVSRGEDSWTMRAPSTD